MTKSKKLLQYGKPFDSWADDASLFRMDCITSLGRKYLPPGFWGEHSVAEAGGNKVCLTFDDGPDPHTTEYLLEVLEELQVSATFFVLGSRAAKFPDLIAKIAASGHEIGNHSYNHHFLPILTTGQLEKEVDRTNQRISEITSADVTLFRAPYGIIDQRAAECLRQRKMMPVYWGAVAEDWGHPGAPAVINRVMRRLPAYNLVVLHERKLLSKQTIQATRGIIERSRENGYDFVKVGNLLTPR